MKITTSQRSPKSAACKSGLPPGTMLFIGNHKRERPRITIFNYNRDTVTELDDAHLSDCQPGGTGAFITWINVSCVHDIELIGALGGLFHLHPMTLEDIVNTTQRPKLEEFDDYLFIVLKMMTYNPGRQFVDIEHVSMILGSNYLISFQEKEGDVFDSVRMRIRTAKGRVRQMDVDYLAYALMDAVVDEYYVALEKTSDRIEDLDDQILSDPQQSDIRDIHHLKRNILSLRKAAWPSREVIGALEKSESTLIRPGTKVYWRDLYDHCIQIIDMVETSRDILGGMHDTYLSSLSNRMNDVMKTLTIISTIFIPLTFIAGVYGMNFEHMPELRWRLGYQATWGLMLAIGVSLLIYFRGKRWL